VLGDIVMEIPSWSSLAGSGRYISLSNIWHNRIQYGDRKWPYRPREYMLHKDGLHGVFLYLDRFRPIAFCDV
jgi:hypothetical protein